jgi:hypothetical protein
MQKDLFFSQLNCQIGLKYLGKIYGYLKLINNVK